MPLDGRLTISWFMIMYQASKEDIHLRVSRIFFMRYVTISPAPDIKTAEWDPMPLLTNLHTNRHERLESFYTPEEIRKVLGAVDRTSKSGKMLYLMMLLACVYGLRSYDIKTLRISNIDWSQSLIKLNQHKTKHYLQLPLTEEVKLVLLDYLKNARPL